MNIPCQNTVNAPAGIASEYKKLLGQKVQPRKSTILCKKSYTKSTALIIKLDRESSKLQLKTKNRFALASTYIQTESFPEMFVPFAKQFDGYSCESQSEVIETKYRDCPTIVRECFQP